MSKDVPPCPTCPRLYQEAELYQRPEDVDGEEGDGERDEAHGLQPAAQLKLVLSPPQTQPAGDGCQRRDEQEAHHVAEQSPLLVSRARVPQPLWNDPEKRRYTDVWNESGRRLEASERRHEVGNNRWSIRARNLKFLRESSQKFSGIESEMYKNNNIFHRKNQTTFEDISGFVLSYSDKCM